MINLQVDEAYAFDYLSIMEVKKNLAPSPLRAEGYEKCLNFLRSQVSDIDGILSSQEYKKLYESNVYTFGLVDKARNNQHVSAKEVDDANMERFHCKQALQKSFFSTSLIETKIL
jgi:hypothetical protein